MPKISWSDFVKTQAYHEMQIGLQAAGYHLSISFDDNDSAKDVHIVQVPENKKLGPEITD